MRKLFFRQIYQRILKISYFIFATAGISVLIMCTSGVQSIKYGVKLYVSTSGNDSWSGKISMPNEEETDGPFATIERARDTIRILRETKKFPNGNVIIEVQGGLYELPVALELGVNDGGLARLSVGGTVVTHLINCSISYSHDAREVTTKTSTIGAKDYLPGLTGWTLSGESYFAEDATYGYSDIRALIANRTAVQCQYGTTSAAGSNKIYKGDSYISSLNRTAGNQGESETYTIEVQGTGALTEQALT